MLHEPFSYAERNMYKLGLTLMSINVSEMLVVVVLIYRRVDFSVFAILTREGLYVGGSGIPGKATAFLKRIVSSG